LGVDSFPREVAAVLVQFNVEDVVTFFETQCRMMCIPDGEKHFTTSLLISKYTNVTGVVVNW